VVAADGLEARQVQQEPVRPGRQLQKAKLAGCVCNERASDIDAAEGRRRPGQDAALLVFYDTRDVTVLNLRDGRAASQQKQESECPSNTPHSQSLSCYIMVIQCSLKSYIRPNSWAIGSTL